MVQVATRVSNEILKELKNIEKIEQSDRATVLRKLLIRGIREWTLEYALKKYLEGSLTTWKAAEEAGLSLYEFIDILKERRIPAQYTNEDLEMMNDSDSA